MHSPIYLYFPSKEALLGALQQRFVDNFCGRLQDGMDRYRPDNHRARLKAWVETGLQMYLDHVALHDVVFHEYRPEDRRMSNDNAVITQLAALLGHGAAAGTWSVDDATMTAVTLFNALHGVADDLWHGSDQRCAAQAPCALPCSRTSSKRRCALPNRQGTAGPADFVLLQSL